MSMFSQEILGHQSGWLSSCRVPTAVREVITGDRCGLLGLKMIDICFYSLKRAKAECTLYIMGNPLASVDQVKLVKE